MKFKLKERMAQNRQIAYTAIGVSLSILLLSFSYVLPFSSIIMMFFVPILSCLIVFNTNWKYQLMYLGIISLVCFIDIQEGFFYLLPNTIIGLFYGNLIKKKISIDMLFLLTVILSTFLNSISYFPIKLFFKVDMIDVYRLIFKMDRSEFVNIYPVFCYFISMIETFFLILISEEELKKFKINIVDSTSSFGFAILGLILSSISLTFIFTNNINIITIILSSICIIPLSISLIECFTFYFSSRLGKMILSISAIISLVLFFFILSRNVKMFIPFSIIFSLIVYPLLNIFTYLKSKYFSIEQNSKFIKF
ncbi:MAG: DUF2232 domain-containing protein [Bacilli bacterium]